MRQLQGQQDQLQYHMTGERLPIGFVAYPLPHSGSTFVFTHNWRLILKIMCQLNVCHLLHKSHRKPELQRVLQLRQRPTHFARVADVKRVCAGLAVKQSASVRISDATSSYAEAAANALLIKKEKEGRKPPFFVGVYPVLLCDYITMRF